MILRPQYLPLRAAIPITAALVVLGYMLLFVFAVLYSYAHTTVAIAGNAYVIMAHNGSCSATQVLATPADENRCRNKGAAAVGVLCALLLWICFCCILRRTARVLETIMKSMEFCYAKVRSALTLKLSLKQCYMELWRSVTSWRKAVLDAARVLCKQAMSSCSACWHAAAHALCGVHAACGTVAGVPAFDALLARQ